MNKEISVKEYLELEKWLETNVPSTTTLEELIEIIWNFTKEEKEYLLMAKKLPKADIECAIEYYDSFKGLQPLDEIKFVNDLAAKYSVDRKTVIKRIQQVRGMNRIKKLKNKSKKRQKY